jgi:cytochrome b involved in lipid metabolism
LSVGVIDNLFKMADASTPKTWTLAEVAKHHSEKDLWLSIDGNVYDVSGYANDHPGGIEIMMQHAGSTRATSHAPRSALTALFPHPLLARRH